MIETVFNLEQNLESNAVFNLQFQYTRNVLTGRFLTVSYALASAGAKLAHFGLGKRLHETERP